MGFETGAGEFMQAGSYSAAQLRRSVFWSAARTSANTPGLISGGLLSATDMQLSAAGSGLVVLTSVGECLVPGTESTSQGGYHGFLSSQNSTTLATANPTNPRIDLLCATSGDSQYTLPSGGTSGALTIQAQTGTPTSGATLSNLSGAPALPASSLLLGYVLVPATATSLSSVNISNRATVVTFLPVGNTSARAYRAAGQSITSTISKIPLDTLSFNNATGSMDVVTNGRYNVPTSGTYLVMGQMAVNSGAAQNEVYAFLYKNGSEVTRGSIGSSPGSITTASNFMDLVVCSAGDYLELWGSASTPEPLFNEAYSNYLAVKPI